AERVGLIIAALGEELVYRLAVLIVVGVAVAAVMRRPWRNAEDWGAIPGIVALLAGGLVFSLLPGHIAQMNGALTALPFASLGVVLGYAVLRTGALLPAAVVHAFLNIATIAVIVGDVSVGMRTLFAFVALVALVSGTTVAVMRLGMLRRAPGTVDLLKPTAAYARVAAARSRFGRWPTTVRACGTGRCSSSSPSTSRSASSRSSTSSVLTPRSRARPR